MQICTLQSTVPQTSLFAGPFWLRKTTTDAHNLLTKIQRPDGKCQIIHLCLRTDIRPLHSMRYDALHDLNLINW